MALGNDKNESTKSGESVRLMIGGATGRMGRSLIAAALEDRQVSLTGAWVRSGDGDLGEDVGTLIGTSPTGVVFGDDLDALVERADIVIDFTRPEASLCQAHACARHGKGIVIGTTGFSESEKALLSDLSQKIPVVLAPNMSVGVNLCFKLLEIASRVLGEDADIEIIEAHHRNKVDAPSGTALKMGEVIAHALGRNLEECAVYGRSGQIGIRDQKTIGFETIRAGDIVGEHTVMFATEGERIEIVHKASSRATFSRGAIAAAKWLVNQRPGLYDMQDVLNLNR